MSAKYDGLNIFLPSNPEFGAEAVPTDSDLRPRERFCSQKIHSSYLAFQNKHFIWGCISHLVLGRCVICLRIICFLFAWRKLSRINSSRPFFPSAQSHHTSPHFSTAATFWFSARGKVIIAFSPRPDLSIFACFYAWIKAEEWIAQKLEWTREKKSVGVSQEKLLPLLSLVCVCVQIEGVPTKVLLKMLVSFKSFTAKDFGSANVWRFSARAAWRENTQPQLTIGIRKDKLSCTST